MSEKSAVALPGALAAIFTSESDRAASWERTIGVSLHEVAQLVETLFRRV